MAHRIQDLDQVPHLRHMEAVQAVKNIYIQSLLQMTSTIPNSIRSSEEEHAFATLLSSLYENHASVLVQMAKGAYQLRTEIRKQQQWNARRKNYNNSHSTTESATTTTLDSFA